MNRVFVCGDTHGLLNVKKISRLVEKEKLTYDDYIIICGDAGIVWSDETTVEFIKFYESLGINILFIDGNHENFNDLKKYPIETWCGGCTHRISEHIRYLCRSQVFDFLGRKILTLGGADSHDKEFREENVSWWRDESITKTDIEIAYDKLLEVGFEVDYILTHTPSNVFAKSLYELFTQCGEGFPSYLQTKFNHNKSGKLLDDFEVDVKYKKWFCGHWHIDEQMGNSQVLYEKIVEI
ncbi:MAG: metallophosphoesterase [Clostridia bacterium]|nr:metallophosphoesterase [Clostridia bacterium]